MFGLKYKSAVAYDCRSTDEEYQSTFAEKCWSTKRCCCRSMWIVRSKSAGSEKSNDFSFFLLVLRGMHLKEIKKNFYQFFE